MSPTRYDTIVIGSGAGGLSAAVALAQAGQTVLVCEQHEVPGGWLHSFGMEGYQFNTGVHYVGELGKEERLLQIYEGLGVSRDMTFLELNPDGYDHVLVGNERFDIPKGKDAYIARLKQRFSQEAAGIDRLFRKIDDIYWVFGKIVDDRWPSVVRRPGTLHWFARSGQALINHHVENPLLRAVLAAQSGDHGLPPSKVAAAVQAGVIHHYFEGAYHPRGGGMTIARAFVRALRRAGGELRLRTPVRRILLDGTRVMGVELANERVVQARHIVSNADPETTFGSLIGRGHVSRRLRRKLDRVVYSTSCLCLFLAVDCDLKALGLDSGNYWIYDHADLDRIYRLGLTDYAAHHAPPVLFVTATTMKDPGKMHRGHHQLEVFTFVSYDTFARWENQRSGHRDADYELLKSRIADRMLTALEQRFPGIRDAVVFRNLATPLTNAHYINAHRGNIYGIDKGVWQAGPLAFRTRTEFNNLYLCGASTMANGVAYATHTGLTAAARILRCHPYNLLRNEGPELQIYPCDDLSQWPERDRRRVKRRMR